MLNEYEAASGMRIGRGNRSTGIKPFLVSLYPPQILTWPNIGWSSYPSACDMAHPWGQALRFVIFSICGNFCSRVCGVQEYSMPQYLRQCVLMCKLQQANIRCLQYVRFIRHTADISVTRWITIYFWGSNIQLETRIGYWWESQRETDHKEDQAVGGWIILGCS
jgi:hypothetical protein